MLIAQTVAQQHCGTTPAPAVVARVIAIVAARMTAMISFLINLTSFAAQPALARGKPETKRSLDIGRNLEPRSPEGRDHTPGHRCDLDARHDRQAGSGAVFEWYCRAGHDGKPNHRRQQSHDDGEHHDRRRRHRAPNRRARKIHLGLFAGLYVLESELADGSSFTQRDFQSPHAALRILLGNVN